MMYGNLRLENILIKLNDAQSKIEDVKFINFGNIIKFDEADKVHIPERIEHFPPEFLQHLLKTERF